MRFTNKLLLNAKNEIKKYYCKQTHEQVKNLQKDMLKKLIKLEKILKE